MMSSSDLTLKNKNKLTEIGLYTPSNTVLNRESYMSAHVLLNLLDELGKKR